MQKLCVLENVRVDCTGGGHPWQFLVSSGFRFGKVSWQSHAVARTVSPGRLDSVSLLPCAVSAPPASGQTSIKRSRFNTGMLYIHGVLYQQLQEA